MTPATRVKFLLRNICLLILASLACGADYTWSLPAGFPVPRVPADNPMTVEKVTLGRHLFYDKRLSGNGTEACATCHVQKLAFTDGKPQSVGSTGQTHPRGSMSLVNVAYSTTLTWANPNLHLLEEQARTPMFGAHPVEMGVDGEAFLRIARSDVKYQKLFHEAYAADSDPFSIDNVICAIACFERTIISARSPYDRYHFDRDDNAISASAKHGEELFYSARLVCFRCHSGIDFGGTMDYATRRTPPVEQFHNNGLSANGGIFEYTGNPADGGKFKVPTLRNIALTAPYMHDGSLKTLDDVIDHYAGGGKHNPNQDPCIQGFTLAPRERTDLLEFLKSLTDEEVIRDPRFSDPWK